MIETQGMLFTSPRFAACMPFILTEEGGYSNTPGDHGGATNHGIIQKEYNLFRFQKKLPLRSVKLITSDEYNEIYWTTYWQPHCPNVADGLDLSLFNINVNGGSGRGTKIIQQCIGVPVDGVWGPVTTKTLNQIEDIRSLIVSFHDWERRFYDAIIAHDPSQKKFSEDWHGRNDRCEKLSLQMAGPAQPAV